MGVTSLLDRYKLGEHRQVWDELVQRGSAVFENRWHSEAVAVANETMRRAAFNHRLLVDRLMQMEYRFAAPPTTEWRVEPPYRGGEVGSEAIEYSTHPSRLRLAAVERAAGPLPISISAFWRMVGRVDLSGSFRSWTASSYCFEDDPEWPEFGLYTDPLNISDEYSVLAYCEPSGDRILRDYLDESGLFQAAIGSDYIQSAGFSGGTHSITLPDQTADPIVVGIHGREGIRFVEYLRIAFSWGGFPGFEFTNEVPAEIAALRDGLLPL